MKEKIELEVYSANYLENLEIDDGKVVNLILKFVPNKALDVETAIDLLNFIRKDILKITIEKK